MVATWEWPSHAKKRRLINRSAYEGSLRRRGDLMAWFSVQAIIADAPSRGPTVVSPFMS
jgi:hypothetical protein